MLKKLKDSGYRLMHVENYYEGLGAPTVFIRHDVDRMPGRALDMARAEREIGALSTYYFRCDDNARFPIEHIEMIKELGHQIGYHYEVFSRANGDSEKALELFGKELAELRKYADIKTCAAHGAPLSEISNMSGGQLIKVRDFELLGEVYLDIDYQKVLYMSDSGGIFGSPYNLRDWSNGKNLRTPTKPLDLPKILHPDKEPYAIMGCHPERWPKSIPGYLQAELMDMGVVAAKRIIQMTRKS